MGSDWFVKSITSAGLEVCETAESFLQSTFWGRFKSSFGWTARAFVLEWEGFGERPLLVLSRALAPGFSFAYIPWGPELPQGFPICDTPEALKELAEKLKKILPRNTVFLRFDPPWFVEDTEKDKKGGSLYPPLPFRRASADIQAPDTVHVDVSVPADLLLAAMKPKWRYNTGLAEKRGVIITEAGDKGLDIFYKLLEETARRDGIAIHSPAYYQKLFELCGRLENKQRTQLRLYIASHEADSLAAIVVLFRNEQATYLYGASSNIKRNLMAAYALQWKAMQDAKSQGCIAYDLFGIPPSDDSSHPMAGLYRFKTGFGGKIVHRPGSWDYPCKPLSYTFFSAAESLRKKIRDKKKRS